MWYQKSAAILLALWLAVSCLPVGGVRAAESPVDSEQVQGVQPEQLPMEPPALLLEGAAESEAISQPEAASVKSIASFDELRSWLKENRKAGGRARLQNDIVLEADETYEFVGWPGDAASHLDVGPYTIYVRGMLTLYPYLEVSGEGGEHGIFHVEPGGFLCIVDVPVTAEAGYAIYQENGGFLVDFSIATGEIRYAEKPVVWSGYGMSTYYGKNEDVPVAVLPPAFGDASACLPTDDIVWINENGNYQEASLPVQWETEDHGEELESNTRFVLSGRYEADVDCFRGGPACLVVFQQENAPVFLQCATRKNTERGRLNFTLYAQLWDASSTYRLEWSTDNENWYAGDNSDYIEDFWGEQLCLEGAFYDLPELPRYFSLAEINAAGDVTYSDTIELLGDDQISGLNNGGGRNGETAPGDPGDAELPPITFPPPGFTPDPDPGAGGDDGATSPENPAPPPALTEDTAPQPEGDNGATAPDEDAPPAWTEDQPPDAAKPMDTAPQGDVPVSIAQLPERETPIPSKEPPGKPTGADASSEQPQYLLPGSDGETNETVTADVLKQPEPAPEIAAPENLTNVADAPVSPAAQVVLGGAAIGLIGAPVYCAPLRGGIHRLWARLLRKK